MDAHLPKCLQKYQFCVIVHIMTAEAQEAGNASVRVLLDAHGTAEDFSRALPDLTETALYLPEMPLLLPEHAEWFDGAAEGSVRGKELVERHLPHGYTIALANALFELAQDATRPNVILAFVDVPGTQEWRAKMNEGFFNRHDIWRSLKSTQYAIRHKAQSYANTLHARDVHVAQETRSLFDLIEERHGEGVHIPTLMTRGSDHTGIVDILQAEGVPAHLSPRSYTGTPSYFRELGKEENASRPAGELELRAVASFFLMVDGRLNSPDSRVRIETAHAVASKADEDVISSVIGGLTELVSNGWEVKHADIEKAGSRVLASVTGSARLEHDECVGFMQDTDPEKISFLQVDAQEVG